MIRWNGKETKEFTIKEGFGGQETNRSAGVVDSKGRIWIGTDQGVTCYQEEFEIEEDQLPLPIIRIADIKVAMQSIDINKTIMVAHNNNDLEFFFKTTSFIKD